MIALLLALTASVVTGPESVKLGSLGTVSVHRPPTGVQRVVLYLSGDAGLTPASQQLAASLATDGALVAAVDVRPFLKRMRAPAKACAYPASEFEMLAQMLERQEKLPRYLRPVLVGEGSGATLAYLLLQQAPLNTFQGAVSLGFCPDLPKGRTLCKGHHLKHHDVKDRVFLDPVELERPWTVLQGSKDRVCSTKTLQPFVASVGKQARLTSVDAAMHEVAATQPWDALLRDAVKNIAAGSDAPHPGVTRPEKVEASGDVPPLPDDLPLVELPTEKSGDTLVVMITGDGGWASLDRELGESFQERGYPVVGLDALRYFWTKRTPDEASADLRRILLHYLAAWHRSRVVVMGFSRGADVAPFLVSRLPPPLRAKVSAVVLLSPSVTAEFEFHVGDWLATSDDPGLPVKPEAEALSVGTRVIALGGDEDEDSLLSVVDKQKVVVRQLPGGHHLGGDYQKLATLIAELVPLTAP